MCVVFVWFCFWCCSCFWFFVVRFLFSDERDKAIGLCIGDPAFFLPLVFVWKYPVFLAGERGKLLALCIFG